MLTRDSSPDRFRQRHGPQPGKRYGQLIKLLFTVLADGKKAGVATYSGP